MCVRCMLHGVGCARRDGDVKPVDLWFSVEVFNQDMGEA